MEEVDKTSDFLFYNSDDGTGKVQVIIGDETVWASQRSMAQIFQVTVPTINEHLQNIFKSKELEEDSVIRKIRTTAVDHKEYLTNFYNLDVIIAVGYRVNSYHATKFRIWATRVLKEYLIKGFVLDDERLKQGNNLFNKDFFKELLDRIREIRASEKMFYEKVKELYSTSVDYDKNAPETIAFFQKVQNKLEYAVVGKTAAEIIKSRANSKLPYMNLKSWKNAKKEGNVQKADVTVAKNYLEEDELRELNILVNSFLDYAELQAQRNKIMKMQDWINRVDAFLRFNEYQVLTHSGTIRKDVADKFAEGEYAKYKITQEKDQSLEFRKAIDVIKSTGKLPIEKKGEKDEKSNLTDFDKQLTGLLRTPPPKKDN